jgi:hypothetical protein
MLLSKSRLSYCFTIDTKHVNKWLAKGKPFVLPLVFSVLTTPIFDSSLQVYKCHSQVIKVWQFLKIKYLTFSP